MSRAPATLVALQGIYKTALAASPYPEVDVYLGPLYSGDPDDAVFVGYDGNPEGEMEMVHHTQSWHALGQRAQDEEFDVHCCVLTAVGVADGAGLQAAVLRMYGIATTLMQAVKADPSLGLGPGSVENAPRYVAEVQDFTSYVPVDEQRGVQPRVSFSVHVKTRV